MNHSGIVKQMWRSKISELISGAVEVGPRASALFLPGISALEYVEVYANLGFLDRNLVGVERDPFVYEHLKTRALPLELHCSTLMDALKSSNRKFDVVSYDSQTFFESIMPEVRFLFRNEILKKDGILIVNAMACRSDKAREADGLYTLLQNRTYEFVSEVFKELASSSYDWSLIQPFGYNSGNTKMVTVCFSRTGVVTDVKRAILDLWVNHLGWEGSFKTLEGRMDLKELRARSETLTGEKDLLYKLITYGYKVDPCKLKML